MMRLCRAALCSVCAFGVMTAAASAAPITMSFTASGFENAGTQYPGLNGPVSGSISWDGASVNDPISALTGIDLAIAGHTYTLAEVGVANNAGTTTAVGALARGANAVVGDGAFDDFLLVFDRTQPEIDAFAYSVAGKSNAIWWQPTSTTATYDPIPPPPSFIETLLFSMSGFENAGTQYPGFNGPISGSLTWRSSSLHGPIDELLAISLSIYGQAYDLSEVGVANQGGAQTAIGGLARGSNAVVGDGAFDDFLFVFNRDLPQLNAFAYSIAGKSNAIWWQPTQSDLRYDTTVDEVPEPSAVILTSMGVVVLLRMHRRRRTQARP